MKLRQLEVKNRFLMTPVKTALATLGKGEITEQWMTYCKTRIDGGVGTLILEPIAVLQSGKEHPKQLTLETKENISKLQRLADYAQTNDCRLVMHLNHAGRAANPKATQLPLFSSSESQCPMSGQSAKAMSEQEIDQVIQAFGEKAKMAKDAYMDALEIQMGHGYLVDQFLSSNINQRSDAYGEDPYLFLKNILQEIKEQANLPVILRISGKSFTSVDETLERVGEINSWIERFNLEALHVGWGDACETPPWYYNHMSLPLEVMDHRLQEIKKMSKLPLIGAGRMQVGYRYKDLIQNGVIDLAGFGRQLVADPFFPHNELSEKQSIRCGSCLQGCLASVKSGKPIDCIANPYVMEGRRVQKVSQQKKVAIVGGGPAGLYSGIHLAEQGHAVTLFEKKKTLGGQWNLVYKAPGKELMKETLTDLITLAKDKISMYLGQAIDKQSDLSEYDEVIIATGAVPLIPPIEGLGDYETGFSLFDAKISDTDNTFLVIGGGLIGMEAAEYLVALGKTVTVVEMLDKVGRGMEAISQKLMTKKLQNKVEIFTNTIVKKIENGEVFVTMNEAEKSLGKFDKIIVATGTKSENDLYKALQKKNQKVKVIGDAQKIGQLVEASKSVQQFS